MIQKLQKKFIIVSMLSTFLVLAVIIGTINFLNYHKIVGNADSILCILSDNNGKFPKPEHQEPDTSEPPMRRNSPLRSMSPELPYESRYFSVSLNQHADILAVDTGKIAAVSTSEACQYALQALGLTHTSGFLGDYRYLKKETGDGTFLIFLDCSRDLSTFRSFFISSILVSLLGLASVLALVILFSKIALRPVSESYEKQRQFITDAGHEIKTPLAIIDADAELLEMELGENEWVQGIHRQVSRLSELTNRLIYLSRMEEPKNQPDKAEFCLSDAVAETSESFQALAATQHKSFHMEIAPLLSCYGDEPSIRQLVSILLDNALKYSPEHSRIVVSLQKKGKNLLLSVCNEAEPISKAQLSRLFERFYRADASRNSETGGYGIGLSIAKAIVTAHKGKIWASSEQGQSLKISVLF